VAKVTDHQPERTLSQRLAATSTSETLYALHWIGQDANPHPAVVTALNHALDVAAGRAARMAAAQRELAAPASAREAVTLEMISAEFPGWHVYPPMLPGGLCHGVHATTRVRVSGEDPLDTRDEIIRAQARLAQ
jgi:hypothetical protein